MEGSGRGFSFLLSLSFLMLLLSLMSVPREEERKIRRRDGHCRRRCSSSLLSFELGKHSSSLFPSFHVVRRCFWVSSHRLCKTEKGLLVVVILSLLVLALLLFVWLFFWGKILRKEKMEFEIEYEGFDLA